MNITMHVSLVSNEQRSKLINLMQKELIAIGYEEQAEIDEIIANGLASRLCDLEELIPISEIKKIISA